MNTRLTSFTTDAREEEHAKATTTIKVELISQEGELETIHVTSTWRGLVKYYTDAKVRENMDSSFARRGLDVHVKQVEMMDSEMNELTDYQRTDYASLEALLDTPPPRLSARIINLFPDRRRLTG